MEAAKLRAACAEDVPALVRLTRRALVEIHAGAIDAESLTASVHDGVVERRVRTSWPETLVAEMLGEPVGLATLAGGRIELLWVRHDLRRLGIGAGLMDLAEAQLAGSRRFSELECLASNEAALRFYARRGYRTLKSALEPVAGVEKRVLRKALVA